MKRLFIFSCLALVSCRDEIITDPTPPMKLGSRVEHCQKEEKSWQMFCEMVVKASLIDFLNAKSTVTLFVPSDQAINKFLSTKNISFTSFLKSQELVPFVKNHIVEREIDPTKVKNDDIYLALNGNNIAFSLVSPVKDPYKPGFFVNNHSVQFVYLNKEITNGYMYLINGVF